MKKVGRPSYPRIGCSVKRCHRGTSRLPPGNVYICPNHWRQVPKSWKRRLSLFRRRAGAASTDEQYDRAARAWWATFRRIVKLFDEDHVQGDQMPAIMKEQLRKDGLL